MISKKCVLGIPITNNNKGVNINYIVLTPESTDDPNNHESASFVWTSLWMSHRSRHVSFSFSPSDHDATEERVARLEGKKHDSDFTTEKWW